jgi:hypothetical protein
VLLTVSLTPAGSDIYIALAGDERWRADYRGELLARVASAGAASRPVFARVATDLQSLEYEATKAIKKTLLMADWIAEIRTQDLENRYHIWAGAVRRTGEELGWLVDALAGVARASGWPDVRSPSLSGVSLLLGAKTRGGSERFGRALTSRTGRARVGCARTPARRFGPDRADSKASTLRAREEADGHRAVEHSSQERRCLVGWR